MNSDLTLEDLTRRLNKLSSAEKVKLRSMLGEEWFQSLSEEENRTIKALLEKSQKQLNHGEGRPFEYVLQDSKKKLGL